MSILLKYLEGPLKAVCRKHFTRKVRCAWIHSECKMNWNFLQSFKNLETLESEFAVLVLNRPILINPALFKLLWNKATLRVLVDGGSNRWLTFRQDGNVKDLKLPSFISGDFDSIKPHTKTYFENQSVKFISTPDQDETDFTKALQCVANVSTSDNLLIKMVFVVCEDSGRFDQIIGNINTLHKSEKFLQNTPVIILSSNSVNWLLQRGTHSIEIPEEFVQQQYACGLIPFCGPTRVTTSGLKWNLNDQTMEFGALISTSNTYSDKVVSISCNRDLVYTTQYCEMDN